MNRVLFGCKRLQVNSLCILGTVKVIILIFLERIER